MVVMDDLSFAGSSAQHNDAKRKNKRSPKNNILFFTIFLLSKKNINFGPGGKKIPGPKVNRSGDFPFLSSRSN